ncbi:hypothetical protein DV453_001613 [Geotrichum candidum]|nr:hypothetical protein DV453_001613 [Geotrichum candidum]
MSSNKQNPPLSNLFTPTTTSQTSIAPAYSDQNITRRSLYIPSDPSDLLSSLSDEFDLNSVLEAPNPLSAGDSTLGHFTKPENAQHHHQKTHQNHQSTFIAHQPPPLSQQPSVEPDSTDSIFGIINNAQRSLQQKDRIDNLVWRLAKSRNKAAMTGAKGSATILKPDPFDSSLFGNHQNPTPTDTSPESNAGHSPFIEDRDLLLNGVLHSSITPAASRKRVAAFSPMISATTGAGHQQNLHTPSQLSNEYGMISPDDNDVAEYQLDTQLDDLTALNETTVDDFILPKNNMTSDSMFNDATSPASLNTHNNTIIANNTSNNNSTIITNNTSNNPHNNNFTNNFSSISSNLGNNHSSFNNSFRNSSNNNFNNANPTNFSDNSNFGNSNNNNTNENMNNDMTNQNAFEFSLDPLAFEGLADMMDQPMTSRTPTDNDFNFNVDLSEIDNAASSLGMNFHEIIPTNDRFVATKSAIPGQSAFDVTAAAAAPVAASLPGSSSLGNALGVAVASANSLPERPTICIQVKMPLQGVPPPAAPAAAADGTVTAPDQNIVIDFMQLAESKYGYNNVHPDLVRSAMELAAAEDMDDDDDDDEEGSSAPRPPQPRAQPAAKPKNRAKVEGKYDLNDPFIDDSEMLWEEKAASTKDGFFVYSGPLMQDSAGPAPASTGAGNGAAGATQQAPSFSSSATAAASGNGGGSTTGDENTPTTTTTTTTKRSRESGANGGSGSSGAGSSGSGKRASNTAGTNSPAGTGRKVSRKSEGHTSATSGRKAAGSSSNSNGNTTENKTGTATAGNAGGQQQSQQKKAASQTASAAASNGSAAGKGAGSADATKSSTSTAN